MDDAEMIARLHAEGLERAWMLFPDDVRAAAMLARLQAAALAADLSPTIEPWPPMRAGGGL